MKLLVCELVLLLCCVNRIKAVTIESCPSAIGGIIQTKLDETITLTCLTDADIEPSNHVELQWYRNGDLVELKEENHLYRSSLCLQPITKEENGIIFTCQLNGDASVNSTVELYVQFAPELNETEDISVEESSDVILSCDVHANPAGTVVWKRDGEVLDLTTGSYKITNNGFTTQLSIPIIKRDVHQGTYTCEVTSPVFGIRHKTYKMTVEDKTLKFPLGPTIAGVVVVACTIVLAIISRFDKIKKCCKRN